jgi:hypothetical protein
MRNQLAQVVDVAVAQLWGISPKAGDIVVAQDSALEAVGTIASAVVCSSGPGRADIPVASPTGNTLSGFAALPDDADLLLAFTDDSSGGSWATLHLAAPAMTGGACTLFAGTAALRLTLRESVLLTVGTPVRILRPFRLSLYRASDRKWYLGVRDWNGATQKLNTVQPVAGPVRAYDADPAQSGIAFSYRDATGALMSGVIDPTRITTIAVSARSETQRKVRIRGMVTTSSEVYPDSASVMIALRNNGR